MRRSSALGRALANGSAKHGVGHWWAQRVTAVALIPLGVWFLVSLIYRIGSDYATLVQWVQYNWNPVLLIALILVVAHHSYLGLQVVVEDYVHAQGVRIPTLVALQLAHVLVATAGVFAVLKIALGNIGLGDST